MNADFVRFRTATLTISLHACPLPYTNQLKMIYISKILLVFFLEFP